MKSPTLQIVSLETAKARLTSIRAWELPRKTSAIAPDGVHTNQDMDPVPPEDQTWGVWTILAYWASDLISLTTWQTTGSILAVGLSWREAIPIMFVGTACIAIPMVLNGAIGSRLHVPFSVILTGSFGYYLRYFGIFSRCILAMFWFGINCVNGATTVTIMLTALAPSYKNITNTLPENAGITTQGMCSFLIFWILQLPFLFIHPTKLRHFLTCKVIITPTAALATMGWALKKAGGGGDIWDLRPEVSPGTSTYAWLWLSSMTSVSGSWATLAVNIPDFTRYTKSRSSQLFQAPFIPILYTICGIIGVITTSASKVFTGEYLWNPLDIIALWLGYGTGGRCAAFFAALAWFIGSVGTNVTANSISAANDLTVLLPRWINIRRGSIVAAVVGGWAFVPWKILSSASKFLAFMGGYSVFLGPIAGIMISDFWFVKKMRYNIIALYDPKGCYRYTWGCNLRAFISFLLPVVFLLPGLIDSIESGSLMIGEGWKQLYSFNWIFGLVTSSLIYIALSWLFPAADTGLASSTWDLDELRITEVLDGEDIKRGEA